MGVHRERGAIQASAREYSFSLVYISSLPYRGTKQESNMEWIGLWHIPRVDASRPVTTVATKLHVGSLQLPVNDQHGARNASISHGHFLDINFDCRRPCLGFQRGHWVLASYSGFSRKVGRQVARVCIYLLRWPPEIPEIGPTSRFASVARPLCLIMTFWRPLSELSDCCAPATMELAMQFSLYQTLDHV